MRGRKPTPPELLVLRGNPGKRRITRTAPDPTPLPSDGTTAPRHLDRVGKSLWRRLVPILTQMRVLTTADLEALALLCDVYSTYHRARAVVRRDGEVYAARTKAGGTMYRMRPEVAIMNEAARRLTALFAMFGLSPADRRRVSAGAGSGLDEVELYLAAGKPRLPDAPAEGSEG